MRAHLDAISARLAPLEYVTHFFAAPEVSSQYLVLGSRSWGDQVEVGLVGDTSLDTEVQVKAVAGTPMGVEVMLRRARGLLCPDGQWASLPVPGRSARITFARSEFITTDIDVTITGTNRHPGVGVDSYRLVSEPV